MPGNAPRDENHVPTVLFEVDGETGVVMPGQIDQLTGRVLVALSGPIGGGDVFGPASSTDNAIARFDGATGKLLQNSAVIISDTGDITMGDATGDATLTLNAGSTRVGTITQVGSAANSPLRINSNGAMTLEVDGTAILSISEFGLSTFSSTVSVPDEAFSSSWNGSSTVPTKNALYDQMILRSSGLYVTVGDSTTNFPVASYTDIGAAINAAYASLPADGGTIFVQNGTYSFSTPIVFGTNGKIADLVGSSSAGTILKWTPTSGNAITINHGKFFGQHRQYFVGRFTMMGTSTFVYVGTTNTRTSVGIFLGGTNGAPAPHLSDITINGFGTQLETGQGVYMAQFDALSLSGGNGVAGTGTGLQGSLVHINSYNNSGERMMFSNCTFSDPCNAIADNAVYVESSGSASLIFQGCSFDNTQLRVIGSTMTTVDSCHIENPTFASYGRYVPMYFDTYTSGQLTWNSNEVVNGADNSTQGFDKIVVHGVNLTAIGNHISNYNGQTISRIFDNSLSSGSAEYIAGTIVEGGGVTEISEGWAYTRERGIGAHQNYSNSTPTGFVANADSTVNWKVGANINALTSDATGNLTTAANVVITGTLDIGNVSDTTLSRLSAGVLGLEGVAIPTISSTNTLTNKTMTGATNTITASLLKSATTEVSISAATAPTAGQVLRAVNSTTATWQTIAGGGDVVGPASATDNAVARFDSTTGKLIQNSAMTVDDNGAFIATDNSKVSGTEGGGFGYIVFAIENLSSGGRAELSFDTDDGAFAGFLAMAGSATTNEQRQMDLGTRVAGDLAFWTSDTTRVVIDATTGIADFLFGATVPDEAYGVGWNASLEVPTKNAVYDKIESVVSNSVSDELAIAYAVSL